MNWVGKTSLFFSTLLLLSVAPLSQPFVSAQEDDVQSVGLSISPAITEIIGEPGSTHQLQLRIQNITDEALPLRASANSLITIDDMLDKERQSEFDASTWVTVDQENLLLAPEETANILVKIDVPQEANPGGHYANVSFRVVTELLNPQSNAAQIVPEISSSLFITVPGDIVEQAEIDTSELIPTYISKGSGQTLKFKILNTGNVHILPIPRVSILKAGGEIEQLNFQPQIVLPNSAKEFEVDWTADVGYGAYEAQVHLIYGSESTAIVSEPSKFYVGLVWWQMLILIPGILILLYLLVFRKNIPKAIKVIKSKKVPTKGQKYSTSPGKEDISKEVGDLEAISEFLGTNEAEKPNYLLEEEPEEHATSAIPIKEPSKEETIEVAVEKKVEEDIEEIPVSPDSTVTEFNDDQSKDTKTVIIQTSGTTIIRQEPKSSENAEEPKPTKPKPIKIEVKAHKEEKPKKKAATKKKKTSTKAKKPVTRAEKTAKKAPTLKAKSKKKASTATKKKKPTTKTKK